MIGETLHRKGVLAERPAGTIRTVRAHSHNTLHRKGALADHLARKGIYPG